MNKVICDVCGTDYPETAAQCPICGSASVGGRNTSAGNTALGEEEKPAYTYVKGGRFSKSNVRKRLKENQKQPEEEAKPVYDDDDDEELEEEQESNVSVKGLVIIVILLLLAIIAVSSYIAITYLDFGKDDNTLPTGTTGSNQSTTAPTNSSDVVQIPCTGITLTDSAIELKALDSAWRLSYIVEPADTTDEVIFTSSDESVAMVDSTGNVTAVGSGEAVITITCGEFTAECPVVCDFETDATDPTGDDPTDPTDPGEEVVLELNRSDFTLSAQGSTWNLYNGELDPAEITWTSGNEEVVTVENGKVTAVGPGRTRVFAEYEGQKVSCWVSCSFKVEEPTEPTESTESTEPTEPAEVYSLMINGSVSPYGNEHNAEVTILVGESFTLTVENEMNARMSVEWAMSADGIVSVDGFKVLGESAGKVTLTAEYEGQTFTCIIIVREVTVAE